MASRCRSLWHNRDFLLLWSGTTVSVIGTQASQLAFALLVLFLTHSPEQAGFAGALRALPYFVLSLPGSADDRWNRKRVMALLRCRTCPASAASPSPPPSMRSLLTSSISLRSSRGHSSVLFDIAEVSCLAQVVSKDQLAAATARNQAAEGTSYLLGPVLGGRSMRRIACCRSWRTRSPTRSPLCRFYSSTRFQGERGGGRHQLAREVGQGLVWLWRQPVIFFMALLSSGINFLAAGTSLVVILLAQRQGASSVVIGEILGISGIGSIAGALIAPRIQRRVRFGVAIALAMWANAILWPLYAFAPNPLALGIITALIFINGPIYNVVNIAYRLALVPDELQGRVNSVVRLISLGAIPPGLALAACCCNSWVRRSRYSRWLRATIFLALASTFNSDVRRASARMAEPSIQAN